MELCKIWLLPTNITVASAREHIHTHAPTHECMHTYTWKLQRQEVRVRMYVNIGDKEKDECAVSSRFRGSRMIDEIISPSSLSCWMSHDVLYSSERTMVSCVICVFCLFTANVWVTIRDSCWECVTNFTFCVTKLYNDWTNTITMTFIRPLRVYGSNWRLYIVISTGTVSTEL